MLPFEGKTKFNVNTKQHFCEESYLPGYNPVQSVESQPTFQRSVCYLLASCFVTVFLLGLLFNRKYGGDMFFRNVG
jgi:hypothetical protein